MSAHLGIWIVGGATSVVSVLQAQDSFFGDPSFASFVSYARIMYCCLGPFTVVDLTWLKGAWQIM